MKNRLINGLSCVTLIAATLICFGCLDTEMLPDILLPETEDEVFDPLPPGEGLSIGESAPEFSLPDGEGNLHSLSNYAGQVVVIVFYATGS